MISTTPEIDPVAQAMREIRTIQQKVRDLEDELLTLDTRVNQQLSFSGALGSVGVLDVTQGATLDGGVIVAGSQGSMFPYQRTITADTHDLRREDGRTVNAPILRLQSDAARDLTGIVPDDVTIWQYIKVINGGSFTITLKHNDAGSTNGYRFSIPESVDHALASGAAVVFTYDASSNVWRLEGPATVKQIRTIQTLACSWSSGGGNPQDFTLTTALTDFTKAYVAEFKEETTGTRFSSALQDYVPRLTSNTNLRINGNVGTSRNFYATIIELQNLDA